MSKLQDQLLEGQAYILLRALKNVEKYHKHFVSMYNQGITCHAPSALYTSYLAGNLVS